MKNRIIILIGSIVFWYVLFVLGRIAFLLIQAPSQAGFTFPDALNTIRYGFLLDLSMSSYVSIFPGLLLFFSSLTGPGYMVPFFRVYQAIVSIIISLLLVVDISLYSYWGFRLDATPLFYMGNLKAMTASAGFWTWFLGFLAVGVLAFVVYKLYIMLFIQKIRSLSKDKLSLFISPFLLMALFIPIRGGIGVSSSPSARLIFQVTSLPTTLQSTRSGMWPFLSLSQKTLKGSIYTLKNQR
ncbi:MAG: hypothetical protein IPH45_04935 [Bacteroidales bacterium]|nr:hypothetical protein [Bacteroidales bacterium]